MVSEDKETASMPCWKTSTCRHGYHAI